MRSGHGKTLWDAGRFSPENSECRRPGDNRVPIEGYTSTSISFQKKCDWVWGTTPLIEYLLQA
jgi:hypothetical protein